MILVDKRIRELVKNKEMIVNFNDDRLNSISYDVVIDKFVLIDMEVEKDEYVLSANDFVYIKTYESLCMPNDLCCNVVEKNSLMRRGLKVDGPMYQPGHNTKIFLRVCNLTKHNIILTKGMKIAQLVFMELSDIPDMTYDMQIDAKYNDEDEFRS